METLNDYLTNLASEQPTPGGGSAAMLVAAMGASLLSMVASISMKNPRFAERQGWAHEVISQSDELREAFLERRVRDEAAFERVMAALALPKGTVDEQAARKASLQQALREAASEPFEAARDALQALQLAEDILNYPNRNLISDVGCAAEFLYAAVAACAYNVRVNLRSIDDAAFVAEHAEAIVRYEREATHRRTRVRNGITAVL